MRISIIILSFFFASCNSPGNFSTYQTEKPCQDLKDTVNRISVFKITEDTFIMKRFVTAMQIIESKGMKLRKPLKVEVWTDIHLPHYIDTCNRKIVKMFILKNVQASLCRFVSPTPLKGTKNYFPGFEFTQWNFANNADRDSAFKIMSWVYTHGDTDYEYLYNQTVVGDRSLYLIEPRAKIFEQTGIEYANYLRQHISNNDR